MQCLNQCTFIGNVGNDPVISTHGERKCARLQIAVNKVYKKDGEFKTRTTWVNIQHWRENMDYFTVKKGDTVWVTGELMIDEVEKDGYKFFYAKINAERINIIKRNTPLDKPQESTQNGLSEQADLPPEPSDDLPF